MISHDYITLKMPEPNRTYTQTWTAQQTTLRQVASGTLFPNEHHKASGWPLPHTWKAMMLSSTHLLGWQQGNLALQEYCAASWYSENDLPGKSVRGAKSMAETQGASSTYPACIPESGVGHLHRQGPHTWTLARKGSSKLEPCHKVCLTHFSTTLWN